MTRRIALATLGLLLVASTGCVSFSTPSAVPTFQTPGPLAVSAPSSPLTTTPAASDAVAKP